jgi:signal transduction histidine kinase
MPEPAAWAAWATRWRRAPLIPWQVFDVLLAIAVLGIAVGVLSNAGVLGRASSLGDIALLAAVLGATTVARRSPVVGGLLACPVLWLTGVLPDGKADDTATISALFVLFVLAYRIGSRASTRTSLLLTLAVLASWQAALPSFNPIVIVDTVGPWLVGAAVRSRALAQAELEERGRELARERQRQADESVRYERARIARELHDIVAHCVSVMVVQAGAGLYLADSDPAAAGEALDAIADQAGQAADEVARLFALLDPESAPPRSLDDLVRRARAGGLDVGCRVSGDADLLPPPFFEVVYRVAQEALTNAVKHAPGATIEIVVGCRPAGTELSVTNGPGLAPGLGLAATGGGHGIAGMRERLAAYDGRLDSGPTVEGGWQVRAFLPAGAEVSAGR